MQASLTRYARPIGSFSNVGLPWQAVTETLFVACAPVAAFFMLRICLINQAQGFVDPWFYTGYGQAFKALQQFFGWTYYALRFPVILPYLAVPKDWDPVIGYAIFRYAICLLSGVPLYLWARHYFGVTCAVAAYLFLFCNPLFPRLLLWDLTPFVSVPLALAGMTLWKLPFKRQVLGRGLAGFCFCCSVNSHAFTGTAIALFFLVEAVHRLLKREWSQFILLDVAAPLVGALVCLAIGLGCYYLVIGPFDPRVFITVTLNAIRAGDQFSGSHSSELGTWIWQNTNVLVPPILVGFVAIGFPRELLRDTVISRVWWFSFLYCAGFAVYQFIFGRFVLETFYYFFHLTLVVYLLFPICLFLLTRQLSRESQTLVVGTVVGILVIYSLFPTQLTSLGAASTKLGTNATVLVIGGLIALIAAIYLIQTAAKSVVLASLYAMALTAGIQYATISAHAFGSILANPQEAMELDAYRAGVQMIRIFARYATPSHKAMLWFSGNDLSARSLASTALVYSVNRPYQRGGLPNIGEYELKRLELPHLKYVMMVAENPKLISAGKEALVRYGYKIRDIKARTIGGSNFKADIDLVALDRGAVFTKAMAQAHSVPLGTMVVAVQGASLQPIPHGLTFRSLSMPWSYIGQMPLRAECIRGGGWIAVDLRVTRGAIGIGVLNHKGDSFLTRVSVLPSEKTQTIVLPIASFGAAGDLTLQNWNQDSPSEGVLQAVRVASRDEVASASCGFQTARSKTPGHPQH